MAATIITPKPMPKRMPWLRAHGVILPPAAEYSVMQPIHAKMVNMIMNVKFRLKNRSFRLNS